MAVVCSANDFKVSHSIGIKKDRLVKVRLVFFFVVWLSLIV